MSTSKFDPNALLVAYMENDEEQNIIRIWILHGKRKSETFLSTSIGAMETYAIGLAVIHMVVRDNMYYD